MIEKELRHLTNISDTEQQDHSDVVVPHPPSSRRSVFCRQFKEEQKDNIFPHRDTMTTQCRRLPHRLSIEDCGTIHVPHPPPSKSSEMMPADQIILPTISNEVPSKKIISGASVPYPPCGRNVSCKKFLKDQKDNIFPHRDTITSWWRRHVQMPHRPRMKDSDTVKVPHPPPSGGSEMEPAERVSLPPISEGTYGGNRGLGQSSDISMSQNGVTVSNPRSGRTVPCRQFKKEQKVNFSPHRDTFSTWCRRPVPLPDCLRRDIDHVNATGSDESNNQNGVGGPRPRSEWLAYCKEFKEEQKDKPSVHQDTFSTWSRQLPKVIKNDRAKDASDLKFSRFSKLPDIKKDNVVEEKGKLFMLLEDLKGKQDSRKIPESLDHRDGDSSPKQDTGKKEYDTFCRWVTEGCWDLWCIQKYIADIKATQRDEVSDRHSTVSKESIMRTFVSRQMNVHQKVHDIDARSTSSTDSWSTDDSTKLLKKLCYHRLHLHASLKSFIEEKETAWAVDMEIDIELEYEKIEKASLIFRMYRDLCLKLMLTEWHSEFHMDQKDPFYFKDPQDMIHWIKCLGMTDLLGL